MKHTTTTTASQAGVPRNVPRNVPTLTEVVGERLRRAAATAPAGQPLPIDTQMAQAVLAELMPTLEHRISEAIARVVHEQMLGLNARVRSAVADEVHAAVGEALLRPGSFSTAPRTVGRR